MRRINQRHLLFTGMLVIAASLLISALAGEKKLEAKDIAKNYTALQKITAEPVYINPGLARMCAPIPVELLKEERLKHGPHALASVLIYMNDLAAQSFTNRTQPYPVGSVIVKKKEVYPHFTEKPGKTIMDEQGVGGMIKREPGYDPANGDWEYFYFEKRDKIESGRIATCVKCHANAHEKDHVYGTWRTP